MPIDYGLANLSHYAYVVTIVGYGLALLAFAGDFAFGRDALAMVRPAREPAAGLVPAGAAAGAPGSAAAGPGG
ncbi:MAG TPA: c-type cytochrome biogenesis protein CcsB, partial [Streptosporangiaceae bacterium]|nr:c-type cytochrome biogenesis protein CcsB [Streptosporangiaceae bacterium]